MAKMIGEKMTKLTYGRRIAKVILIYPFRSLFNFFKESMHLISVPIQYLCDFALAITNQELDEEIEKVCTEESNKIEDNNMFYEPIKYECPYKVLIPQKLWLRMIYYVKHCQTEMGGHIVVEALKNDRIKIIDVLIPKQEVSGTEYVPNHRDLAKYYPKAIPHIKGWFHSHVSMMAFWSPTDDNTIENNIEVFKDYCISIVMNKKGEYKIRMDINEVTGRRTYDDLPLYILLEKNETLEKLCIQELTDKVKIIGFIEGTVRVFKEVIHDLFMRKPKSEKIQKITVTIKEEKNGLQKPAVNIQPRRI